MNTEMIELKQSLLADMLSYMEYGAADDENDPDYDPDFDAGYTEEHVKRCGDIIDDFFGALEKLPADNKHELIMDEVKSVVLRLNQLAEETNGCMIETGQREQLCDIIISAANHAGLVSDVYDITEEWREW